MDKEKVNYQREIEMCVICTLVTYLATNLFGLVTIDMSLWTIRISECVIYMLIMIPSLICYLMQKHSLSELIKTDKKQCVMGIATGIALAIVWVIINYSLSLGRVGIVTSNRISTYIYYLIHYIIFVAVSEEFVFRIYLQGTLEKLLGRYKVIAPAFSAVVFGLFHIINCNWFNVILAFVLGLLWGYIRYFWKKCSFIFLVFVHGFFDYGIYIIGYIIFKIHMM